MKSMNTDLAGRACKIFISHTLNTIHSVEINEITEDNQEQPRRSGSCKIEAIKAPSTYHNIQIFIILPLFIRRLPRSFNVLRSRYALVQCHVQN